MQRAFYIAAVCLSATASAIAAQQPAPPAAGSHANAPVPRVPAAPNPAALATIQGHARTGADAPLPEAPVRLRDARSGRIVAAQTIDASGQFAFRVEPGSYVVELVGRDGRTVLAASRNVTVNAGDSATAVVRLPMQPPILSRLFGTSTLTAATVAAQAASAGILVTSISGAPTCETLR
jgi:hypothetical protein